MEKVMIHTDYIKLGQLLKLSSVISQGSDAKILISDGQVSVNGAVAMERGRKIYAGDIVEVEGMGKIQVAAQ